MYLYSMTILTGEVILRYYQFAENCELEEKHGCLVRVLNVEQILVYREFGWILCYITVF